MNQDMSVRFMAKVDRASSPSFCWIWVGAKTKQGYGAFNIGGSGRRIHSAHRLSYEHFMGQIPAGLVLDHGCRNPSCVNPRHLEPVTYAVNTERGTAHQLSREAMKAFRGTKRPREINEKVAAGLQAYWDSGKSLAHRERLSVARRTRKH